VDAFCNTLLPKYFKHNKFQSFMRQLNMYHFRKIRGPRWQWAHDNFVPGCPELLSKIVRKPKVKVNTNLAGEAAREAAEAMVAPVEGKFIKDIHRLNKEKDQLTQEITNLRENEAAMAQSMLLVLQENERLSSVLSQLTFQFQEQAKTQTQLAGRTDQFFDLLKTAAAMASRALPSPSSSTPISTTGITTSSSSSSSSSSPQVPPPSPDGSAQSLSTSAPAKKRKMEEETIAITTTATSITTTAPTVAATAGSTFSGVGEDDDADNTNNHDMPMW